MSRLAVSTIREAREEGFEKRKIRSCRGLFWFEKLLKKKKGEQGRVCSSLGEGSVSFGLAEDTPGHSHVPRCKRKESFVTLRCTGGKSLI